MRRLLAVLLGIFASVGMAVAAEEPACAVAEHLVETDASLPRVADAITNARALSIVVIGTSSSTLPGPSGARIAYPARLEAALAARLKGVTVKVTAEAVPRRTAAEMAETFPRLLSTYKPALVIWQTGTFDAIRGVETESFSAALENGIRTLHEGGADVVFMNQQFSPRTEGIIPDAPYNDAMRWIAIENEIPVFDRSAIMRHWNELGTFQFYGAPNKLDVAARVHECLGRLLAKLILEAAKVNGGGSEDQR